jgi:hypothetical protein
MKTMMSFGLAFSLVLLCQCDTQAGTLEEDAASFNRDIITRLSAMDDLDIKLGDAIQNSGGKLTTELLVVFNEEEREILRQVQLAEQVETRCDKDAQFYDLVRPSLRVLNASVGRESANLQGVKERYGLKN